MNPVIEIVIVGDEILAGRTVDKNAVHMRETLSVFGFDVSFVSVIGDDVDIIARALRFAVSRADLVLVSGGLGPTSDDMTVEAAAKAFDRSLSLDEVVLEDIKAIFAKRGWFMSESNRKQAMIPDGSIALKNDMGTAPGVMISVPVDRHPDIPANVFLMPGVPRECEALFDGVIMNRISGLYRPKETSSAVVTVYGIGESALYDEIRHLPGAKQALAFYPRYTGIEIRIKTDASSPMQAGALRDEIVSLMGKKVISTTGEVMETVVGRLLTERGLTIAVAESCTGGLIADRLTDMPGSSAYFCFGAVTYSNESKIKLLGVDPGDIAAQGAVSETVAAQMAEGIRSYTGADIGVSTTGIAGPGGATPDKPVGLMYTGISTLEGTRTKKLQFVEDRRINKNRMSQAVLDIVRLAVLSQQAGKE